MCLFKPRVGARIPLNGEWIGETLVLLRDSMNPSIAKSQSLASLLSPGANVDTFVFYLTCDQEFRAKVSSVWRECAERGLQSSRLAEVEPHITLGASRSLTGIEVERDMRHSLRTSPFDFIFEEVATFPNGTLYFSGKVSGRFAQAHEQFSRAFLPKAVGAEEYYLPQRIVPHCTILEEGIVEQHPAAIKIATRHITLPTSARVNALVGVALGTATGDAASSRNVTEFMRIPLR